MAWRPLVEGCPEAGLTVPYSGNQPMTRVQYEWVLESRLRELIDKDRKRARVILTDSPDLYPDLYQVVMDCEPDGWPTGIVACGQMQIRLNQVDWESGGQYRMLRLSELPSLEQITEAIPSCR